MAGSAVGPRLQPVLAMLGGQERVDRVADPARARLPDRAAGGNLRDAAAVETPSAAAGRAAAARRRGSWPPGRSSALSLAISSAESGEPSLSGGIRQPSSPVTASMIRLSPLCAGHDGRPAVAPFLHERRRIQPQPGLVLQGPVASVTALAQDRLDFAGIVNCTAAWLIRGSRPPGIESDDHDK